MATVPCDIDPAERARAKAPHELFLANLIGNHILMAVAAGGIAGSMPVALVAVPLISFCVIGFTLWRARQARCRDPWYVRCHWYLAARRSGWFLGMLGFLVVMALTGWAAHAHAGLIKEAAIAWVVGAGILPTMVAVLGLILVESEALHQAGQARLPAWVVARFPPPC